MGSITVENIAKMLAARSGLEYRHPLLGLRATYLYRIIGDDPHAVM